MVKRHYSIQLGKMLQNAPKSDADKLIPYLKAQHVQWFAVRTHGLPYMWASPAEIEDYDVRVGDLLVCEGGEGGRSGLVKNIDGPAIIQNALHRVRPISFCRNDYLQYVMSAVSASGWFDAINNKATIAHFTYEKFGALGIPIPPPDEQHAITRYLDHMDRRIRRYIRTKQRLIALLEEQKQAIIHQAVTRGLDPTVRLKPSGVAWLGDVPEHWEIRKLGHVARVFNGTTPSRMRPDYWNSGTIPWLSSGKVNDHVVETPTESVTERALRECSISLVPKGSVIIGLIGQGKTRGKSALLAIDACINQNLAAIVPNPTLDGRFLLYLLTAHYKSIREIGRGGNQEALNCNIIAGLRLPVPPLDEQDAIVKWIAHATGGINAAIDRTQREIALLREYRTRLIADVVTGQVDVRAAAAQLPEEVEEADALPEVEALDEEEPGEEQMDVDEEMDA